jgi:hypothetical protein
MQALFQFLSDKFSLVKATVVFACANLHRAGTASGLDFAGTQPQHGVPLPATKNTHIYACRKKLLVILEAEMCYTVYNTLALVSELNGVGMNRSTVVGDKLV